MLDELRIQNFALIDQWEISFTKGESVFTGETGSGKSIFVDALSFLSGERADRQIQRDPSIPTMVEGIFLLPHSEVFLQRLSEEGIDPEENTLIVRRELTSNGSRQRLNGKAVTVSSLRAIMSFLIDIHSQNAQRLLSNRDLYLPLLDQYIGDEAETQKQELQKLLRKLKSVQKKLDDLELDPEELEREIDLLQYQISEIEGADLEQIHEEELTKEHKKLSSAAGRVEDVQALLQEIENGQSSIRYALHSLARALDEMARKNPDLVHYKDMAWQMDAEAEDLVDGIEKYRDSIVIDPQRLDEIDQIFSMLQRLKRKYGSNTEEILGFSEHAKKRLRLLENAQQEKDSLIEERTQIRKQIKNTADVLSDLRKNGAGRLEKRIRAELLEMAIKKISFEISFEEKKVISAQGRDHIDFLISTNPGEPLQSVSKVASGGEMSRFMLAFRIVFAEIQKIPTLVFDEIDTGISGRTAQVVAEKIARLGKDIQLFVITHLPQIAALADRHYRIHKEVVDGRTSSHMELLNESGRIDEQARLIGGISVTEVTKQSAAEMLTQAKAFQNRKE